MQYTGYIVIINKSFLFISILFAVKYL